MDLWAALDADEPVGQADPPACPYCGSGRLSGPADNGRATRMTCDQCGGTAVATEGGQFMPDLIGQPDNHPSHQPDDRSGGVGGAANFGVIHEVTQNTKEASMRVPFEVIASWKDVRTKAQRISAEGGVHIAVSSGDGIGGTVKGDHDLYETFLTYVPGSRKVGYWNCGCKWAAYSWGRSKPFRRFNGRMCSHALAMQFEALKQHAFNRKQVEEHDYRPAWMRDKTVVVQHERAHHLAPHGIDHRRNAALHIEAGFEPADEPADQHPPAYAIALAAALAGYTDHQVTGALTAIGYDTTSALALTHEAFDETFLERSRPRTAGIVDEFKRDILMVGDPAHADGGGHEHGGHSSPGVPKPEEKGEDKPGENPLDPNHWTHHTEDSRQHAPEFGEGVPGDDDELAPCDQCKGQGCGHCSGAGQVDLDNLQSRVPDQNADAGPFSRGQGTGAGGIPTMSSLREIGMRVFGDYSYQHHPRQGNEYPSVSAHHGDQEVGRLTWSQGAAFPFDLTNGEVQDVHVHPDHQRRGIATEMFNRAKQHDPDVRHSDNLTEAGSEYADSFRHQADYASTDWQGDPLNRTPNPHSDSKNPASTGYATGQDPDAFNNAHPSTTQNFDGFTGAKKDPGPTHAGVVLKAHDTGRTVMLQRSRSDKKDPAAGRWEWPGGGIEPDDATSLHAGIREHEEETGRPFPGGTVSHVWRSGPYQGHVVVIPREEDYDPRGPREVDNPDDDNEVVAWRHPDAARKDPELREECRSAPWDKIKGASLEKTAGWGHEVGEFVKDIGRHWTGPTGPDIHGRDESHLPVADPARGPQHQQARECSTCGAPAAASDRRTGEAFCPGHLDERQSSDRPVRDYEGAGGSVHPGLGQLPGHQGIALHHPEMEGALPFTEGEEDSTENMGATPGERERAKMHSGIGSEQTSATPNSATYASLGSSVDEIVARFQATAGATALATEAGPTEEPGGGDIAAAAAEHLRTVAMKSFTPAEQNSLIMEGEGGPRARNYGDLRLHGTHYEDLPDDEELTL